MKLHQKCRIWLQCLVCKFTNIFSGRLLWYTKKLFNPSTLNDIKNIVLCNIISIIRFTFWCLKQFRVNLYKSAIYVLFISQNLNIKHWKVFYTIWYLACEKFARRAKPIYTCNFIHVDVNGPFEITFIYFLCILLQNKISLVMIIVFREWGKRRAMRGSRQPA